MLRVARLIDALPTAVVDAENAVAETDVLVAIRAAWATVEPDARHREAEALDDHVCCVAPRFVLLTACVMWPLQSALASALHRICLLLAARAFAAALDAIKALAAVLDAPHMSFSPIVAVGPSADEARDKNDAAFLPFSPVSAVLTRTVADGSRILCTPEMTAALLDMFPRGRVPSQLRLLIARDGGIGVESFKAAMLRVTEAVLVIIHATTEHVFGFVLFDHGHVLSDASGEDFGEFIEGDPDNFLFRLVGGHGAPTKLLKNTDGHHARRGLWVGEASVGLRVGAEDLLTFYGDQPDHNTCNPTTYKTVAPGYPPERVTDTTLAGAKKWVPRRSEVFALVNLR